MCTKVRKQCLSVRSNKNTKRTFNYTRKRVAKQLSEESRTKRKKLGVADRRNGRSKEKIIPNYIADKSTAHRRRQKLCVVSFLCGIITPTSERQETDGSATTVHYRPRLKIVRSIAARQHRKTWRFCSKKTLKTDDNSVETMEEIRCLIYANSDCCCF